MLQIKNKFWCPFCHADDIRGSLFGCKGCGAIYHIECCKYLTKCTSCPSTDGFSEAKPKGTLELPVPLIKSLPLVNGFLTQKHLLKCIEAIEAIPHFEEACSIAEANAKGPLYLVGGKIYRTMLHTLYGLDTQHLSCDFDFITSSTRWWKRVPQRWFIDKSYWDGYGETHFNPYDILKTEGNIRFKHSSQKLQIDLMTFASHTGIRLSKSSKTLEGYFKSVPLDIQAIALEVTRNSYGFFKTQNLIGNGLNAMASQRIRINYLENAAQVAMSKKIGVADWILEKTKSLGLA